ncbi:MAG: TonB family protein [Spirochaetaceae bacterium]|jgi:protein TonB|nr:TonB family protein [Spirochaetaceae bacterium]
MTSQTKLRLILFFIIAAVHGILIFFLAFNISVAIEPFSENARIMKLTDIEEKAPPPSPESVRESTVEAIAETMIETDVVPGQTMVATETLQFPQNTREDFLPMHRVSVPPKFDETAISQAVVYPPIARRSGIEGRVILELFIDRTGRVQRIIVLQETPPGRGFGEAAVRAFERQRCIPAEANGRPVSVHYRYPLSFRIR